MTAAPYVTDKALATLRTIVAETAARGYPPTLAELADALSLADRSSVSRRLVGLRDQGLVAFVDKAPRTLRVTPLGARLLADTGGALTLAARA